MFEIFSFPSVKTLRKVYVNRRMDIRAKHTETLSGRSPNLRRAERLGRGVMGDEQITTHF